MAFSRLLVLLGILETLLIASKWLLMFMTNCPFCGVLMDEGFVTLTTDGLADIAWSTKPSVLGLHSESLTSWAILAKNMQGLRCQSCRAVLFRY